ncbi:MAG: hypothetical protein JOZ18_08575, partial [Chloroflexi bacterium]|nr:hypothetical protein [Chloroflexota bacterium]
LDRMYKLFLVASVSHPLTIVRAREILNWAASREYNEILEGRYARASSSYSNTNSNNNGSRPKSGPAAPPSGEPQLVRCPHCGREQMNQRFCSLCGGTIA